MKADDTTNPTTAGLLKLTDEEYTLIRNLIHHKFGIDLTEQKKSLIVGRLQKVLREKGLASFLEYYNYVTSDKTGEALGSLVNRISTNHTFFYREPDHFTFLLETALPELKRCIEKEGTKKLRIWCAGCSSGEEPYMLSMLVHDFLKLELKQWDVGILATDISNRVLTIAKAGVYAGENIKSLPAHFKHRYFRSSEDGDWAVKDQIKDLILFRRFNLMRPQFPFSGKFHLVFCRNVMIYFDGPTRDALVNRFYDFTQPGGYFFIGHSETLGRKTRTYSYVKPAVYRREA